FRAAAEHGQPDAMYHLGLLAAADDDYDGARDWYRQAAEHGRVDAINNLAALCHRHGDLTEAAALYLRAIEADDTDSQPMFNLGVLHHSQGRPDEAAEWWRRAAALGNDAAAQKLALLDEENGD
ncbi:MAG: tetratricopeptide repeat protein, partial [Stackebrandtia sp.]